jgi:cation diffusion facilitator CzcD-associated flavoprotein CzcO
MSDPSVKATESDSGVAPTGAELSARVEAWLAELERSLTAGNADDVAGLFGPDCHWRDLVALTWRFGWVSGSDVAKGLVDSFSRMKAYGFRLSPTRTAPRVCSRMLEEVVEAFFDFETSVGTGHGVVRFLADELGGPKLRAWTLLTALRSLRGSRTPGDSSRPAGVGYDRWETNDNWADRRRERIEFADREPQVLVVGAGQAGLMVAADLGHLGVDTLVVEKNERVGDNWRNRYHALALHNPVGVVQMPYMPFPASFPEYLPKDVFGNWLEAFAVNMNINSWTSTELLSGTYDEGQERWTVLVGHANGTVRELHPRHVVLATGGAGSQPHIPQLPGLGQFGGEVVHSSRFRSARDYAGQRALVVGVGTSGHDIAVDLYQAKYDVTMVQRSPTMVVSLDSADSVYSYYADGTPLDEADLISMSNFIYPVMYPAMQVSTAMMAEHDKALLDSLRAVGMRLHNGIDGTGFTYKFFEAGGGYYIDVGASGLLARREISLIQADELVKFDRGGAHLSDGRYLPLDIVVMATGFLDQGAEAQRYFGEAVAEKIGAVSRFGEDGEIRNAWKATPQKGLWFIIGGVSLVRTHSPLLALQIKAAEEGLFPGYRPAAPAV